MRFKDIFQVLLEGRQLRRQAWPDDGAHIAIVDEKVMIWRPDDKSYHPLILSVGDIKNNDWVECERSLIAIPKSMLVVPQ